MEIYSDNAATTRPEKTVTEIADQAAREDYGNPSSLHLAGVRAEVAVRTATEQITKTPKAEPVEFIFTLGGTESDNLAILGAARSRRGYGRYFITGVAEHLTALETIRFLEEQDSSVTVLPVDTAGKIALSDLEVAVREDTILILLMYVNNEIGAIQPAAAAMEFAHRPNPDCYFHTDAVQAYGKFEIYPKRLGTDLLSTDSHKIAEPKGVGFLYKSRRVSLKSASFDGGQQGGLRSDMLNAPGIAGTGEAAREAYSDPPVKRECLLVIKDRTLAAALGIPGVSANNALGMDSASQILSLSVEGVRAEVLLYALEAEGIFVPSGSACASNHPGISATLRGIGLPKQLLNTTIRLGFPIEDTEAEAECFSEVFRRFVPELWKFRR